MLLGHPVLWACAESDRSWFEKHSPGVSSDCEHVLHCSQQALTLLAQFSLPTTFDALQAVPPSAFMQWVHDLHDDTFVVPVNILEDKQRSLLLDFACTWAFLHAHEYLRAVWEEFVRLQLSLAYTGMPGGAPAPRSNEQLAALSKWAREGFPVWHLFIERI